ncbi:DUF262 domain-containing protein [Ectothiorhodospiraceae bacterium BW-2]|nr:DUF262 domain-containing protein [Ectothiorhodospiraceae bacterium BW-2]
MDNCDKDRQKKHELDKKIISVRRLLSEPILSIPAYQRPYKWSQKNLNDLLGDLRFYRDKPAYRLGAVVFHHHCDGDDKHEKQEKLDIVDGQQRTLTLILIVKALLDERVEKLEREDIKKQLLELTPAIEKFLSRQHFKSDISHHNLHQNFMAAKRAVARKDDFTETDIDFLLNRCQLVTFVLTDISEAFQFFDSQNARGRDLEPHDLLKAFHLREFAESESHLKAKTVQHWENLESDTLAQLFANYLYRIRHWVQGKSARYFSKADVGVFKGVNLDRVGSYPYVESLRIAHHFVDDYNSQYQRHIDHQKMDFPFHLDQMIINGRRFFEMAEHYQKKIGAITHDEKTGRVNVLDNDLSEMAYKIVEVLNSYPSRTRTGDRYIRTLFDCALIFYIDKFGTDELSVAIEKLFIWAYRCRLKKQVVQLATMDNHALEDNVFERIKHAIKPLEILSLPLETIKSSEANGTKLDEITALFKGLKYYE